MSLLIDALKKAEQEKKEAARRLKEAQEKSGEHYQLESRTQDRPAEKPPEPEPGGAVPDNQSGQPVTATGTDPSAGTGLSLSPPGNAVAEVPEATQSHEISGESKQPAFELKDITLENPELSDEEDAADLEKEELIAPGTDRTFSLAGRSRDDKAGSSFENTANATLTGKYSKTISESRVSRSPVSAAELAGDMGGGKEIPTPVAAQTVFSAAASSAGRRQALEWIVFLGLFAMILLAAGSFYYLKITPLTPETSSPLVARGIEAGQNAAAEMPLPEIIAPADQGTGTTADTIASAEEVAATGAGTVPEGAITATPQAGIEEQPSPEAPVAAATTPAMPAGQVVQETLDIPVKQEAAVVTGLPALPEEIKVETAAIAISRSRSVDEKDQLINSAYTMYIAGNYNAAEAEYRKVLDKSPENRDALLGVAAIAYRKGDVQGAYANYLKVIKYYPRDAAAKTALISMQGGTNPAQAESLIKLMIGEQPDAAFLQFALGNLYAGQTRWADAQQAFFDAYRIQPDNPDYAYNLAVSLDQTGQTRTALDYYNKALELADAAQVSFNTASVMTRINTLTAITRQ